MSKDDELEVETRECQDCRAFRDFGMFHTPICRKKLMGVTRTLRVTYKVKEGTCFEEKTQEPAK